MCKQRLLLTFTTSCLLVLAPCNLAEVSRRFRGQGDDTDSCPWRWRQATRPNNPEDSDLKSYFISSSTSHIQSRTGKQKFPKKFRKYRLSQKICIDTRLRYYVYIYIFWGHLYFHTFYISKSSVAKAAPYDFLWSSVTRIKYGHLTKSMCVRILICQC